MALATKTLTAVNDKIEIPLICLENGAASFQLGAGTAGTYVLEATLNGIDWVQLKITNMNTKVDADNASAAGIYYSEYVGFKSIRVRKTVGAAAETVSLSVSVE